MKLTQLKNSIAVLVVCSLFITSSCKKLDENLSSELNREQARALATKTTTFASLLQTVYLDMTAPYTDYSNHFGLQEATTDELIVPSRPSGWDDDGVWRKLYLHSWDSSHPYLLATYNSLNKCVYDAGNILTFSPPADIAAQARFLRAYSMYSILDLFGKFPYREPGSDLILLPKVYSGVEGINFIISEIESILPDLPATGTAYVPTKQAAYGFLARLYLNKGVYPDRSKPTFDKANMDKVIANADNIVGKSLDFYWNNFQPANGELSKEQIFTLQGVGGSRGLLTQYWWYASLIGSMTLPQGGGWNGFATTPDFYASFSDGDIRKSYIDPIVKAKGGFNVGFIIGQQFGPNGAPLANTIITPNLTTLQGEGLYSGVRVIKYVPDYTNVGNPDNDFMFIRYADVQLMKAEALLRNGNASAALTIVNMIRSSRSATPGSLAPLSTLTLDDLLAERGRELYWEGTRRPDLIRFGKFLNARLLKPVSADKYLIFAIPQTALLANANLTQNPGY
ncbi:RagB/SusD family nutrient uptake outer membrane protein [Pedobacter sp. MC2016-05]|uniref:RagB/SusD family nutrient uptake outer membrane protein n=1 Tax=Pedobacter sp. MC2016-05 TaxID=2994474 RepID=UPI0022473E37|nr:RagB/SusD family nutrient uptake outer membrane protein [Pedobacter sp. MC2016-05]MCX2473494.1 RagB/SusD family nutrient uptake outer membrane protein [Pedobacter sp. MC2016-05]